MNTTDSITIDPADSLLEALQAIDAGGLGLCCVLDDARHLAGIITDGDVRRALIRGAQLTDRAASHMNTQPTVVSPTDSRVFVLDLLQARGFAAVPVVDHGRVVAMHTLRSVTGKQPRQAIAVIMAGGRGTRLGSLTDQVPKPMLEVGGRPIIERIVLQLVGDGITRIYISVNYLADIVMNHFKDGSQFGATISYLEEDPQTPLGTAGALALLPDDAVRHEESIIVLNGDLVTEASLGELVDRHRRTESDLTIGTTMHQHQVPFGVVESDNDVVVSLTEKPTVSWTVSAGIHLLEKTCITEIPPGTRYDMPDLIASARERGMTIMTAPLEQPWADVGLPEELARARGHKHPESGPS